MTDIRSILLGFAVVVLASTSAMAAPGASSNPLFDEKLEFAREIRMSGQVAPGLQASLVLYFEATNRNVPGLGNLDGLPLPVMTPKKRQEVLRLEPDSKGRYSVSFRTLAKTRWKTHFMLRHVMVQVDAGSQSRDRLLLGTFVFFGQTGVPCESLRRIVVSGLAENYMRLQLDGEQPNLSKHTFGLIPNEGGATTVKLDVTR